MKDRSEATQTIDDSVRRCPYCGHEYQPEGENYSEDEREEECESCGKVYWSHDSFTVTHYATPDCELNNENHDWQERDCGGGRTQILRIPFCARCDKTMPVSLLAEFRGNERRSD